MLSIPPIITIDGPSGAGKGAVCRELSKKLRWNILDSGAIYRVLALEAISHNVVIDINHEESLVELASNLSVKFIDMKDELIVLFKGKNINHRIYTEVIGNIASKIAIFPKVRTALLQCQKNFHVFPGLIANGRDMGTVVFPSAILKVFLDASLKVRCERRVKQLKKNGFNVSLYHVSKKIQNRDVRDYTRKVAPLVPAIDSLIFDSTNFSLNEIVCVILKCFYNSLFY